MTVLAPQLGVNDMKATLAAWCQENEAAVSAGQPLCVLETTKATFDVEAEGTGYVVHLVPVGQEVDVNQPIALLGPDLAVLREHSRRHASASPGAALHEAVPASSVRATDNAARLAAKLGIELASLQVSGIIREQDVLKHYNSSRAAEAVTEVRVSWQTGRVPVMVYGAGKGAITVKECLDLGPTYEVVCFIDDNMEHAVSLCGLPVYHSSRLDDLMARGVGAMACAIASADVRLRALQRSKEIGYELINVIHPRSYVSSTATLGAGNYIKAGALIDTNTKVGNCCIIDNGVTIPHDNVIEDGCHIAPGVTMGSSVVIGEKTIVGIGSSIATDIHIGKAVIVSVGSAVTKNIPDFAVVEGVPAKVIGTRKKS